MQALKSEKGNGSVMVLLACGGIILFWVVFTSVMDVIGDSNHKRIRGNLERLNAFEKPPPVDPGPRQARGYQVNY